MAFAFQVIGPGRGGTTLLACLIGHHPRCEILLEEFSRDLLMGRVDSSAELIPDLQARTKQRIDNFLKACIDRAALTPDKLGATKPPLSTFGIFAIGAENLYRQMRSTR